jgi:beta-galactosidase
MDGSVTPRAEMAGNFAHWANSHPDIWKSHPVKGDIGIVFAPESELFNYVQQGDTNFYAQSARGAYQAFFDANIQADFVALDNLSEYKIVYLPYPVMLKKGLPAYFGDHGHVGEVQPNYGLDELFGARERYVEFTPDLLDNLELTVNGHRINGRYFLQEYDTAGGQAVGKYANGHVAAVGNRRGKGRTLLIGTFPGAGYYLHHSPESKAFFIELLKLANVTPRLENANTALQSRLHEGPGGNYLWITNPTRSEATITVSIGAAGPQFQSATDLWANRQVAIKGRSITLTLPGRDGAVIALR